MTGQHFSESGTGGSQSVTGLEDRIVSTNQLCRPGAMFCATQDGMTFACTRLDDGGWIVTYRSDWDSGVLTEQPVHVLWAIEMMLAALAERQRRHAA